MGATHSGMSTSATCWPNSDARSGRTRWPWSACPASSRTTVASCEFSICPRLAILCSLIPPFRLSEFQRSLRLLEKLDGILSSWDGELRPITRYRHKLEVAKTRQVHSLLGISDECTTEETKRFAFDVLSLPAICVFMSPNRSFCA